MPHRTRSDSSPPPTASLSTSTAAPPRPGTGRNDTARLFSAPVARSIPAPILLPGDPFVARALGTDTTAGAATGHGPPPP